MSQARAFSDTEIITIAAVAAAALGGIVVGLGRGQEDDSSIAPDRQQLSDSVRRARETVTNVAGVGPPAEQSDIGSEIKHAIQTFRQGGHAPTDGAAVAQRLGSVADRIPGLQASSAKSLPDRLKLLGRQALETGLGKLESTDWAELRQNVRHTADQARQGVRRDESATEAEDNSVALRLGDEIESIEKHLAEAPEAAKETGMNVAIEARRRVSDPASRAASSAGNAAKESLAALAWLGLGTAVVYFGLLSDERREQVKQALCGAVEQARLLALDFQGYEPEM